MLEWRILIQGKCDPAYNMALDEAILLGLERGDSVPTIRFYDWEPATVSIGYHQDMEREVDIEAVHRLGYGLVRRPTGGRVVLHKDEVTYSIIAPLADHLSGSVLEVYGEISQALSRGLRAMGVAVEFEKGNLPVHHQREASNPCFSSSSRYELHLEGKKVVGSAQARKGTVFLQHGSILLNGNQSPVAEVLPNLTPEQREKLASYLARKTISINDVLQRPLSFDEAVSTLIAGIKESWGQDRFQVHHQLESHETEDVNNLLQAKYLQNHWIYGLAKKNPGIKNNLT